MREKTLAGIMGGSDRKLKSVKKNADMGGVAARAQYSAGKSRVCVRVRAMFLIETYIDR